MFQVPTSAQASCELDLHWLHFRKSHARCVLKEAELETNPEAPPETSSISGWKAEMKEAVCQLMNTDRTSSDFYRCLPQPIKSFGWNRKQKTHQLWKFLLSFQFWESGISFSLSENSQKPVFWGRKAVLVGGFFVVVLGGFFCFFFVCLSDWWHIALLLTLPTPSFWKRQHTFDFWTLGCATCFSLCDCISKIKSMSSSTAAPTKEIPMAEDAAFPDSFPELQDGLKLIEDAAKIYPGG